MSSSAILEKRSVVIAVAALVLAFVTLVAPPALLAGQFAMRTNLSGSDASFLGEDPYDYSGFGIAGIGDVNGDGYDDFLIGSYGDSDGGTSAGQVYLILGKATPTWGMDFDLSNADASFIGEEANDNAGMSVAGAGDVNGDGYADFLIGATGSDSGGSDSGQVYLILGKATGWAMRTDLSTAAASFIGEGAGDNAGSSVAGVGQS